MAVRRNYRINLRNYGNPPAIMVSQYDENYDLVFEVYDGVVPATGLNAYTVKLVGRQPGNDPALKYEFTGTVSGIANNILSFTIDTTMTGRAGKGTAEIVILDTTNDVKFASFNLPVYVEKAAVPDDAIDADVERAQEIAEQVEELIDGATEGAEAWAVGQRGGVDVESTDPTYHNNAKYYSEVAQDIADSIGIDATLSISGKAADAKKTGDEISSLKEDLNDIDERVTDLEEGNSDRWTDDAVETLVELLNMTVYSEDASSRIALLQTQLNYTPTPTRFLVTNNLTNCTSSNDATRIASGDSYTATVTPASGYTLGAITVTMGGTDISSTAVSDDTITIASVTGDLVITARATMTYTLVPATSGAPNPTTFVYSKNNYSVSAVYENNSNLTGGKLICTVEPNKLSGFNASLWLFDAEGNPYKFTGAYKPDNKNVSGEWIPYWHDAGNTSASYASCAGSFYVDIPEGCKVFAWFRFSNTGITVIDETLDTGAKQRDWAMNGGITVTLEA